MPDRVIGDPGRLGQIIRNLANNAIKFTPTGSVVISVGFVNDPKRAEGVMLRFEVKDSGIGIPADRAGRLFQSFSQVDAYDALRKYGGTGLGLAICKRLVEMMGGEIGVQSVEGKGVYVLVYGAIGEVDWGWEITKLPEEISQDVRRLRVLGVDDNAVNRDILQQQLAGQKLGFGVQESGVSALLALGEAARRRPFDLVILDWHMPGMDGLELARAIRADAVFGDVALVMLASMSDQVGAREMKRLGLMAWLPKFSDEAGEVVGCDSGGCGAGAGKAMPEKVKPRVGEPKCGGLRVYWRRTMRLIRWWRRRFCRSWGIPA